MMLFHTEQSHEVGLLTRSADMEVTSLLLAVTFPQQGFTNGYKTTECKD